MDNSNVNVETSTSKAPKENNNLSWKIATFVCAILAIAGCGAAAFLFFTRPQETPSVSGINIDALKTKMEIREDETFTVRKSGITNDDKYYYAIVSTNIEGMVGAWSSGTWYREAKNGSEWKELFTQYDSLNEPVCSEMTDEQRDFIKNYSYIDDDFENRYVYCEEYSRSDVVKGLSEAMGDLLPVWDSLGLTEDGQYYYVIFKDKTDYSTSIEEDLSATKVSIWYRKPSDEKSWKSISFTMSSGVMDCSALETEEWKFLGKYSKIDEEINEAYLGCLDY